MPLAAADHDPVAVHADDLARRAPAPASARAPQHLQRLAAPTS